MDKYINQFTIYTVYPSGKEYRVAQWHSNALYQRPQTHESAGFTMDQVVHFNIDHGHHLGTTPVYVTSIVLVLAL